MRDERGVFLVISAFVVFICVAVLIILFDGYQRNAKREDLRLLSDEALSVAAEVTSNLAASLANSYRVERQRLESEYGGREGYAMCGGRHMDNYSEEVVSLKLLDNYERAYLMGNDLSEPAKVVDTSRESNTDPCDDNPALFRNIVYIEGRVYKTVPMYGEEEPAMPELPDFCNSSSSECIEELVKDYVARLIDEKKQVSEGVFWEDVANNLEVKVAAVTDNNPLAYECDMQLSSTRMPPAVRVEISLKGAYKTLFHPPSTPSTRNLESINYIDIPLCSI